MAVALFPDPVDLLIQFVHGIGHSVGVGGDRGAGPAAPELIEGHVCQLALDIPKGHVDAGHGIVDDRSVPPIGIDHHQVPQIFDLIGIPSDQDGL